MNWNGSGQPTFVVRISGGRAFNPTNWAMTLAPYFNLTVEPAVGTWENKVELGVTFTLQGDNHELDALLDLIARVDPDIRWVHVERHTPRTAYVDLDERRTANDMASA